MNNSNIKVIGLTGQSGAGKSTFCHVFAERGYNVVDCDRIAKEITCNPVFLIELDQRFPVKLLKGDGSLDRKITADAIFSDIEKLRLYNGIIFPYIIYDIIGKIKTSGSDVLLDAPTLFESGLDIVCDEIIAVTADKNKCIDRIVLRDGLTREQAKARIASQNSADFFRKRSDYLIENNGSIDELRGYAEKIADRG